MGVGYDDLGYVKRPNLELEYTEEQIREVIKCKDDFLYFCNHIKIVHPDHGKITFVPRDYQVEMFDLMLNNRFVVAKFCRQSGKTTCLAAFIVWCAIFNSDKFIGIASNKSSSAKDFLSRVKIMYEALPIWLKPGVTVYNVLSMDLENGTRIEVSATSKNAFRGRSIWLLCLDELAHVPPGMSEEFWAANYHTITSSVEAKVIILSTPNGMFNLFWSIYTGAEKNHNSFKHLEVTWDMVPGRDEAWKEEQLLNMTYEMFEQEQNVVFLGSSSTVIDSQVLRNIIDNYKNPIVREYDGHLLIYEKPIEGARYIIGVDVAKGTGQNYSALQALKIKSLRPVRLEEVATYNCNTIDVYKFSELICKVGYYYNNAIMLIENNAEGSAVVNRVWWDLEYTNMYNSGGKTADLGIRATKTTKPKAVLLMKKLIEDYSLILVDKHTLEQLADFAEQNQKFGCTNLNDDLISALYWSCHILNTEWLEETFEFDKSKDSDDVWGVLSDVEQPLEDWSWLTGGQNMGVLL